MRVWYLALLLLLALVGAGLFKHQANATDTAKFIIEPEVVAADVQPFTATIGASGNGVDLTGAGGFEPTIFRTLIRPTQDAPDRIVASPQVISNFDSWRSGALDGAEVEVLRIVDGKFVSVRKDRIREGGHLASGWTAQFKGEVLPNDMTSVRVGWEGWNRLGVPYYFTVRAVDWMGRLSPATPAVSVIAPERPAKVLSPEGLSKQQLKETIPSLAAPMNLRVVPEADGSATLSWSKSADAAGYLVYRSDEPQREQKGYALLLEGRGDPIRTGDMVFLRKRFLAPDRANLLTNRVWGDNKAKSTFAVPLVQSEPSDADRASWTLREHGVDDGVPDGGQTYLEAQIEHTHPLELGRYNHSGTAQMWYEVFEPKKRYVAEVWLRGDQGVSAKFLIRGPLKNVKGFPARLAITGRWQKQRIEFEVADVYTGKQAGWMGVRFEGKGRVDIDNLRIYRADAGYLEWLLEDLDELKQSAMGGLRTHAFIKTGRHTYDLEQLTNGAGAISASSGNTLPQTLQLLQSAHMYPWLQIEPHFSREEWLGLVEYLSAPFAQGDNAIEKPWAAKRAAQGHPAPFTEDFKEIKFEIGNETWNRLFAPWTFEGMTDAASGRKYSSGEVYGLYQAYVLAIMKSSPYWSNLKPKIVPVIGGWAINSYGEDAARMSPGTPLVTYAAYNGGWDEEEGIVTDTPQGRESVLTSAVQVAIPRAAMHNELAQNAARARDKGIKIGTYEAGPGYQMNGLNGSQVSPEQYTEQEKIMKGPFAGVATLDTFLSLVRAGHTVQNYFTFGRGDYWKSHAKWYHGGIPYSSWAWLSSVNNLTLTGRLDLLRVRKFDVPKKDLTKIARRKELKSADMMDVFAFRKNDEIILYTISRETKLSSNSTAIYERVHINVGLQFRGHTEDCGLKYAVDENSTLVPNKAELEEFERVSLVNGKLDFYIEEGSARCFRLTQH